MKKPKVVLWIALGVLAAAALFTAILITAGNQPDVIAGRSTASFAEVLQAGAALTGGNQASAWTLTSPDGEARLAWRGNTADGAPAMVSLSFAAAPFLSAGFDTAQLPERFTLSDGWLTYTVTVEGNGMPGDALTPVQAYRQLITLNPAILGYHAPMDHFGLKLGGGNVFEWAQSLTTNLSTGGAQDKDAVFVLAPEPFLAAGVDPSAVAGWAYDQVPVMENGVASLVYKFLKPFNLK